MSYPFILLISLIITFIASYYSSKQLKKKPSDTPISLSTKIILIENYTSTEGISRIPSVDNLIFYMTFHSTIECMVAIRAQYTSYTNSHPYQ
jgi:hypothetical protein